MENKVRLIDANAVLLAIDIHGTNKFGMLDEDIREFIKKQPTVDAVPVVHGRWEKQQGIYSCSVCGKSCPYDARADVIEYWTCYYCPNCGAKMDGE